MGSLRLDNLLASSVESLDFADQPRSAYVSLLFGMPERFNASYPHATADNIVTASVNAENIRGTIEQFRAMANQLEDILHSNEDAVKARVSKPKSRAPAVAAAA